jgi:basic membrane protein A and related proteins
VAHTWLKKAATALLTFSMLAGCATKAPAPPTTPAPGGAAPAPTAKFKVGMVTDVGGLNDESFNASAWAGLNKAKTDLGFDIKAVESKRQEEYETNFQTLADQKFDLIWGVGLMLGDPIDKMSKKLTSQKFGIVDNVVNSPNVASVTFKEEEGSFLMGVMAAKLTKTKKIGFIGGMAIDVIAHFEAGFKAGVKATDPSVNVITVYSGTFTDPSKGKSDALAVYGQGADIIFHAAGNTGVGVISAAKEQNKWVIGVDQDQNKLAPANVVSSMMKRVDVAVYDVSKATQGGTFPGGKTTVLGLKEDGVGYSPSTLWDKMPGGTKELVDKWAGAIKDGKVTVPNSMDKLKSWDVPKI